MAVIALHCIDKEGRYLRRNDQPRSFDWQKSAFYNYRENELTDGIVHNTIES